MHGVAAVQTMGCWCCQDDSTIEAWWRLDRHLCTITPIRGTRSLANCYRSSPVHDELPDEVDELRYTGSEGRDIRQRRHSIWPKLHFAPIGTWTPPPQQTKNDVTSLQSLLNGFSSLIKKGKHVRDAESPVLCTLSQSSCRQQQLLHCGQKGK